MQKLIKVLLAGITGNVLIILALYAGARLVAIIPADLGGANHGPWWGTWVNVWFMVTWFSLFITAPISFFLGIYLYYQNSHKGLGTFTLWSSAIQAISWYVIIAHIAWVVL